MSEAQLTLKLPESNIIPIQTKVFDLLPPQVGMAPNGDWGYYYPAAETQLAVEKLLNRIRELEAKAK